MAEIPFISGNGNFELQAVGARFHMDALISIMKGSATASEMAELIPEEDNEYDPDAVAVIIKNEKIGYISNDDLIQYREWLEEKIGSVQPIECSARIKSNDKYGFCIDLDLDIAEYL